jgi:hypothetical protein
MMVIKRLQTWIVCESTGRWAAALRTAFSRSPHIQFSPRICEVRSPAEFYARLNEESGSIGLVEVRQANLADVLKLISGDSHRRPLEIVALLDHSPRQIGRVDTASPDHQQQMVGILWEAGATAVIESPLHMCKLAALGNRRAAAVDSIIDPLAKVQSVEAWARSRIPWQDPTGTLA